MLRKIFWLISIVSLTAACTNPKSKSAVVVQQEKDATGRVIAEFQMDTVAKEIHGYYKSFYENGNLQKEMTYEHGKAVGSEKQYYLNGKVEGEFVLVNGIYDGPFKYYFPDGTVKQEGKFVNDAMSGELKTYYENGKIKESVTMDNGVENGPFTEYFESGGIKAKGAYKDKKEHCILEVYNENGSGALDRKMICREGTCCTIWNLKEGDVKPSSKLCAEIIAEMNGVCSPAGRNTTN